MSNTDPTKKHNTENKKDEQHGPHQKHNTEHKKDVGSMLLIFLVFCLVFLVGSVLLIFLVFCVVFFGGVRVVHLFSFL
jgi:flagellar basal body-associated protein FliL